MILLMPIAGCHIVKMRHAPASYAAARVSAMPVRARDIEKRGALRAAPMRYYFYAKILLR